MSCEGAGSTPIRATRGLFTIDDEDSVVLLRQQTSDTLHGQHL